LIDNYLDILESLNKEMKLLSRGVQQFRYIIAKTRIS